MTALLIVLALIALGLAVWLWRSAAAQADDRPVSTSLKSVEPAADSTSAQIAELAGRLKDTDRDTRRAAAEALGRTGDPRAADALVDALQDEARSVREAAAAALGALGAPRAVEPLLALLRDEGWSVRKAAADALGKLGDLQAVAPLIELLRDPDRSVRRAAAAALGALGDARAVEPLIEALQDEDALVREDAARALGMLGDPRAVEPLLAAASAADQEQAVRAAAVAALGRTGDTRVIDPLMATLREGEPPLRTAAADALGEIGEPAIPPLLDALRDSSPQMRRLAVKGLSRIQTPYVMESVASALHDADQGVRWSAAEALRGSGWLDSIEPAEKAEAASVLEAIEAEKEVARRASLSRSITVAPGEWGVGAEAEVPSAPPQPSVEEVPAKLIEYAGKARLPRKVYEGDSQNVSLVLKRSTTPGVEGEVLTVEEAEQGKVVTVRIEQGIGKYLEVELVAAGITVSGERKQKQPLGPALSYRWNCYFPNSGTHEMSLVLRLLTDTDAVELGAIDHRVKVTKLGPLTQRQVQTLASVASVISGGLAIAEVLHALGVW